MSRSELFTYSGTRILARHGRRPGEADWERLERVADFGHFLQNARETGLEPFVRHLAGSADAHEVERSLRGAWATYIDEVAGWQPAPWRPAARWLAVLAELPPLAHLRAGDASHRWMERLPALGPAIESGDGLRPRLLARGRLGPVVAEDAPAEPLEAWLRHWHHLLPAGPGRFLPPLEELAGHLRTYRAAVADGDGDAEETLERRLVRTLRRHGREPAGAYAHLGLVALDVQRLRRDLLLRRLLPEQAA